MNLTRLFAVTRKEWMDSMRDRRTVVTALVLSFLGPAMIGFMFNRITAQEREAQEIKVPVLGQEYAPVLVKWLTQQAGVQVTSAPPNPEEAVRKGTLDFALVIPKEFAEQFRASKPALVKAVLDSTKQSQRAKVQRLRRLLGAFSGETGGLRLIAHGVSPQIATALKVEDLEVSSAQERVATIFNMIPMFLVIAAFAAGMHIATDATAGERERGSLEPLLINPVPRIELAAGKWLAAVGASAAGILVNLGVTTAMLFSLPLEDLGFRFNFGPPQALLLLACMLPIALLAPAMQMYLATFAKSFKEAQSYISFLLLFPMLPGIAAIFYPLGGRPWLAPIPILGQYALATDVLGGKEPAALWMILALISMIVCSGIFVVLTGRLFQKEKIIFGR
jgi:sodium transport system permease protein